MTILKVINHKTYPLDKHHAALYHWAKMLTHKLVLVGVHEAALQLVYWSSLSYTHHCYLPFSFKIISQIRLLKPLHVSYFVKCLTVTEKGIDQHVSDFDELETLLLIFIKNFWFIYINLPP